MILLFSKDKDLRDTLGELLNESGRKTLICYSLEDAFAKCKDKTINTLLINHGDYIDHLLEIDCLKKQYRIERTVLMTGYSLASPFMHNRYNDVIYKLIIFDQFLTYFPKAQ